jgi:hypothetical protein
MARSDDCERWGAIILDESETQAFEFSGRLCPDAELRVLLLECQELRGIGRQVV